MRIAIIAPPWVAVPPPAYGGTEAVLDNLARGLQAAGHDVLLCAAGDSTCPVQRVATRPCGAGTDAATPAAELHHVVNAYEQALRWGADVVHDHTLTGPAYAQRFDVPVVTTNHAPFESELGDYYRAIARATPVIAVSHHHASTARDTPIAAVIHHGVDVDLFPLGAGDGGCAVFLGRMSPDKGVHRAARIARAAGVPLKIAAKLREPAEHEYYDATVAPLLGGDIEYVGEVSGAEKLELLASAMCLLNPIAWPEPFGLAMVEALACGTPVLAPPCGSVPEIVEDDVVGFVRPDEEAMSAVLQRVDELDRAQCRKRAERWFSTSLMVTKHLELYQRVVTTGVSAAPSHREPGCSMPTAPA